MNQMRKFLLEIREEDRNANPSTEEYFCNTCRTISGEDNIKKIDDHEKNINYSQNGKLYFAPEARRIEKEMGTVGIIFTKNSMHYNVHLKYLSQPYIEGEGHNCGIYK